MLLGWGLIHVASTFGVLTSRYRGIRVRAEHDNHALLVHISEKEEGGGTTLALDQALARGR